jgi:hypothetical protein
MDTNVTYVPNNVFAMKDTLERNAKVLHHITEVVTVATKEHNVKKSVLLVLMVSTVTLHVIVRDLAVIT